jgi:tetratricopeptide (TPR) repeat protein
MHRFLCSGWSVGALCAALFAPALTAQQDEIDKLVQKGAKLVQEGDYAEAINSLNRANELAEGSSIPALVGLSMAYNGLGEPQEAVSVARQAIERADNDQFYWLALGELTLALAASEGESSPDLPKALAAIRQLLAETPTGTVPNRLRQRLCWARAELPAASPESLGRTEETFSRDEVRIVEGSLTPPRQIYTEPMTVTRADERRLGDSEETVIQAVIDTDGCVLGGEIVRNSNDYWTELAFATMRRNVFEPARDGDVPVKAFFTLRFDYPNPFQ